MRNLITMAAAAAMLMAVGLAATTAKADLNYGPVRQGNSCFVRWPMARTIGGPSDMGWGTWVPCSAQARVPLPGVRHFHHARTSGPHHGNG